MVRLISGRFTPNALRHVAAVRLMITRSVLPVFGLVQTPSMTPETFAALTAQFEYLQLARTYGERAVEELSQIRDAIHAYHDDGGPDAVRKYLNRDADSRVGRLGINHWQVATYRAAASSDEFVSGGFQLIV